MEVLDPRGLKDNICGFSYTGPNNIEWICVREGGACIEVGHGFINRWMRIPDEELPLEMSASRDD